MTIPDDDKTPIEQALDVLVYLPLGMVLDFPRSVPRYIDRGREQFDVALRIGRQAVGRPPMVPKRPVDRLQAHTRHTLRALGVVSDPPAPSRSNGSSVGSDRAAGHPAPEAASTDTPNAASNEPGEQQPTPPGRVSSGIDPDSLAITGYDSLSASQVVPRLDSLAGDELEQVRLYEQGARGRKTILSKIAQLQAT